MNAANIHLIASSNLGSKPFDPERALAPLRTILRFVEQQERKIAALTIVCDDHEDDRLFSRHAQASIPFGSSYTCRVLSSSAPVILAEELFRAAEDARGRNLELWVDLTAGPKNRTAILYAAASAIPSAKIVYAERHKDNFEITFIPRLEALNPWLGRHCVQVRDYRKELQSYLDSTIRIGDKVSPAIDWQSIADLLISVNSHNPSALGPRSHLLRFAEWMVKSGVPRLYLDANEPIPTTQERVDASIRALGRREGKATDARAAQVLHRLRNLFAHHAPRDGRDALLFVELISFLGCRIAEHVPHEIEPTSTIDKRIYIAVDGDDVGRRFEERSASCTDSSLVDALRTWSFQVQCDLSLLMQMLSEKWKADFLAHTGDGFLASVQISALHEIETQFRPRLHDATATTGIGPSVQAAYIALKLGKAKNRGGGYFLSTQPFEERLLWQKPDLSASRT